MKLPDGLRTISVTTSPVLLPVLSLPLRYLNYRIKSRTLPLPPSFSMILLRGVVVDCPIEDPGILLLEEHIDRDDQGQQPGHLKKVIELGHA